MPYPARITKALATFGTVSVFLSMCVQCFQTDCNATLSWNVSSQDHPDIPHDRIEELLRCPEGLHGCSVSPLNCTEKLLAVTCSCARNCDVYGSCCWDAKVHGPPASPAKCTLRDVDDEFTRAFYAVSGCRLDWPNDEVRMSCENVTSEQDPFFFIPVTTKRQATYFNAFCALCNYDLDNTSMFWNASGHGTQDLVMSPPQYALDNKNAFFWPCELALVNVDSCPKDSDPEITRRCLTYFAPVVYKREESEVDEYNDHGSKVVYKNVYCGLCNGVNLSVLKCVPTQAVPELFGRLFFLSAVPNILTLIRPVTSTSSCFSWHNGKCYIKAPQYHSGNSSTVETNETTGIEMTTSDDPHNVGSYLTTICLSLSLICLFLKGLVFVLYKSSRTFSSCCTMCLSGTLFWAHLLFLIVNSFDEFKPYCAVFAALLHYGFLSTFFWTSVLSFDIWKNVVTARISSSKRSGLAVYGSIAWGAPMVVVVLGVVLDWAASDFALSPNYGRYSCWIGSTWNQVVFLLIPMAVLLLFDIGLYVHIVVHVRKTARLAAAFDFKSGESRSDMKLFIKLGFIMGFTWFLAFIGLFVTVLVLDLAVTVLVGLQGVYLFFGFKDYKYLLHWRLGKKRKGETTVAYSANTDMSSFS